MSANDLILRLFEFQLNWWSLMKISLVNVAKNLYMLSNILIQTKLVRIYKLNWFLIVMD